MTPQVPINKPHLNQLNTWVCYLEGSWKACTFLPGFVAGHIPESGAFSEVLSTTQSLKLFIKEDIVCCFGQKITGLRGSTPCLCKSLQPPSLYGFPKARQRGNNGFAFSNVPLKHHVTHSWAFQHV